MGIFILNSYRYFFFSEIEDEKTQEYEKYLIELTSYSIEKLQKVVIIVIFL